MLTFFITLFAILFLAASSDTCRRLSPSSETMQLNLKVPLSHLFPEQGRCFGCDDDAAVLQVHFDSFMIATPGSPTPPGHRQQEQTAAPRVKPRHCSSACARSIEVDLETVVLTGVRYRAFPPLPRTTNGDRSVDEERVLPDEGKSRRYSADLGCQAHSAPGHTAMMQRPQS